MLEIEKTVKILHEERGVRILTLVISCLVLFIGLVLPLASAIAQEGVPCPPEPVDMPMQYGDLVTCQIGSIGDIDIFRFSGNTGEKVMLQASRTADGTPCIQLFRPNGTSIGPEVCSSLGARIDAVLDQVGTHTVLVTEQSNNQTVNYNLALQCIIGACTPFIPAPLPTIAITLTGCTTCRPGLDRFTAQVTLNNPGLNPVAVEIKLGVQLPDGTPFNPFDKHLTFALPPGTLGPVTVLDVNPLPNGLLPGTWFFEGAIIEPELGKPLNRSRKSFEIIFP